MPRITSRKARNCKESPLSEPYVKRSEGGRPARAAASTPAYLIYIYIPHSGWLCNGHAESPSEPTQFAQTMDDGPNIGGRSTEKPTIMWIWVCLYVCVFVFCIRMSHYKVLAPIRIVVCFFVGKIIEKIRLLTKDVVYES